MNINQNLMLISGLNISKSPLHGNVRNSIC